jgi:hypothetical protein
MANFRPRRFDRANTVGIADIEAFSKLGPGSTEADIADIELLSEWISEPPPQKGLWDVDDPQFLDKVVCVACINVTLLNPKIGRFEARMKCHWCVRTPYIGERTEPRMRIPGIRMPSLSVTVEESRLWREKDKDTEKSFYWRGVSVFMLTGWEMFEVHDFPFDRQLVNFDLFDFVWRRDKDEAVYEESMRIVYFSCETQSMLPEWSPCKALVEPVNAKRPARGPSYTTRFNVRLRLQRKSRYYILQVALVTTFITEAALLPMTMEPDKDVLGTRLSLYSGGLLTLTAFKFAVAEQLPSVPYATTLGRFMVFQIITLVVASFEAVLAYKVVEMNHEAVVDYVEDVVCASLMLGWFVAFVFLYKRDLQGEREPWQDVICKQDRLTDVPDDPDDGKVHFTIASCCRRFSECLRSL